MDTTRTEGVISPIPIAEFFFPTGNKRQCTVSLFGDDSGGNPYNWSFAQLELGTTEHETRIELMRRLDAISKRYETQNWYAPVPIQFNGRIVLPPQLNNPISISNETGRIWRGAEADGIMLPYGSGFLISTGGCPIIIATDGEQVCAAHAGLESVVPWGGDVVANIAAEFTDPQKVIVRVFYAIRRERYKFELNSTHAVRSLHVLDALYKHGYWDCVSTQEPLVDVIDIPALIARRVKVLGMIKANQDEDEIFLPKKHAHDTRDPKPLNSYRNLIAVTWR